MIPKTGIIFPNKYLLNLNIISKLAHSIIITFLLIIE